MQESYEWLQGRHDDTRYPVSGSLVKALRQRVVSPKKNRLDQRRPKEEPVFAFPSLVVLLFMSKGKNVVRCPLQGGQFRT